MSSSTPPKLSLKEVTALVVLMAEARELTNPQLKKLAGIDLSGPARLRLTKQLGLVVERKAGRANAFTLSEHGKETCLELLAAQPRAQGSAAGALAVLLAGLHRTLREQNVSPRRLFGGAQSAIGVVPPPAGDVESRIRAAYGKLANEPAGWVSLADLRSELGDASRDELDAALRKMAQVDGVRLIPVANLKALTKRDRDAAILLGGEDNHALSIGAS